jgi:hypothetical protein
MRARSILLLLLIVLAIFAPAVLTSLFEVTLTALRDGLANAITGH